VKTLIDHNLDWRISDQLSGHEVRTALEMAWDTLKNALLTEAEKVRVLRINHLRQGIKDQQTMKGRSIAVVVIRAPNNRLETHLTMISQIAQIVTVVSSHRGISLRDEASARGYRRSVDIVFDYRYKSRSIYESCNNR